MGRWTGVAVREQSRRPRARRTGRRRRSNNSGRVAAAMHVHACAACDARCMGHACCPPPPPTHPHPHPVNGSPNPWPTSSG
eukprot:141035-Chlamydomonas_euryale.AAC.19